MSWILISKGDATVSPKLRGHEGGGVGLRGFGGGGCDSHPSQVSHSINPCESHPPANRTPKGCGRTPPHFWDVTIGLELFRCWPFLLSVVSCQLLLSVYVFLLSDMGYRGYRGGSQRPRTELGTSVLLIEVKKKYKELCCSVSRYLAGSHMGSSK